MADLDFAAKMERELQMAAEVQWSMLPAAVPEVPNYSFWACWEPALPVGGDMYEFCRLPTGEILVVVADVGGKGHHREQHHRHERRHQQQLLPCHHPVPGTRPHIWTVSTRRRPTQLNYCGRSRRSRKPFRMEW